MIAAVCLCLYRHAVEEQGPAIAWLLYKASSSTTALIPILGPRAPEQLAGTLSTLNLTLSPDQIARLDETSRIPLGTPHEQIQGSKATIDGGKLELLESPKVPII
jgi:hypothetical protein